MTFVYAERLQSLTYVIADTFWESSQESKAWTLRPCVKIVPLPMNKTAAFAGRIDLAEEAFKAIFADHDEDPVEKLLVANVMSNQQVDFLLIDQDDLTLTVIKNGRAENKQNAFLGSQPAFEQFQKLRHSNDALLHETTHIEVAGIPVGDEADQSRYAQSFDAFKKALIDVSDDKFRGFAIPYVATRENAAFMHYLQIFRAPVMDQELSLFGEGTITFNDTFNGGYNLVFSGEPKTFSACFPSGQFALVHRGFEANALWTETMRFRDEYDLGFDLEEIGMTLGIRTQASPSNDAYKINQYLNEGRLDRAAALFDRSIKALQKKINQKESTLQSPSGLSLLEWIEKQGEIELTVQDLNHIRQLLDLKVRLLSIKGDANALQLAQREVVTWNDFCEKLKFSMKLVLPEASSS